MSPLQFSLIPNTPSCVFGVQKFQITSFSLTFPPLSQAEAISSHKDIISCVEYCELFHFSLLCHRLFSAVFQLEFIFSRELPDELMISCDIKATS